MIVIKNNSWRYAIREVTRRGSRSLGSIAGYAIAIASLLVLFTFLNYAKENYDAELMNVGAHFIAYIPTEESCCPVGSLDVNEGFLAAGVNSALFSTDFVNNIDNMPTVMEASSYISFRFMDIDDGFTYVIGGFDPTKRISFGATLCAPGDLVAGRFLEDQDRGVVMLEKDYANVRKLTVGSMIRVGEEYFEVIGIVNPAVRPARADIYLHIAETDRVVGNYIRLPFSYKDMVNVALIETKDASSFVEAKDEVEKMGFSVFGFACAIPAASVMGMNAGSTWALMVIIAIGTIFFTGKTQFSSVIERQHDIGILKAIGWSNRRVVKQIIFETIIQSFLGALAGVLLALIIIYILPFKSISGIDTGLNITFNWQLIPLALILSVIAGIISSFVPALASARKDPAQALRFY